MAERPAVDRLSGPLARSWPAVAALGVAGWVGLEFALRRGLVPLLADVVGTGRGADALVLAVGFPLIAAVVAAVGLAAGLGPEDWDYDVSLRTVGAGVGGFLAYFAVFGGLAVVATTVLGLEPTLGPDALGLADAPTWALVVLFVGNGLVVPITEELAWRGVVQTALTERYGTALAVALTATAFVLKHLAVDLAAPPFRVASLVVGALVLCGCRAKYGTASSTVAHLGMNVLATASLLLA